MQAADSYSVQVQSVVKQYGAYKALHGVTLDVKDNEFFTFLGPSGCGKTTLLRTIAGFEPVTSGRILLHGADITLLSPNQRPINTVFQNYALFPHMTVAENVAFGMKRLKRSRKTIDDTVRKMLALVQLDAYGDRHPAQLSGGQQQRVALARALAPEPKVLLLDEPLSALDLKLRQAMRTELKALQRETGITFIFVTHDQEEALSMSDRIAVMSQGQVQQIGVPAEIYQRPANRFVADFIGDTNLLQIKIVGTDRDEMSAEMSDGSRVTLAKRKVAAPGQILTLSIRPEHVAIQPTRSTSGPIATIETSSYLGDDTHYELRLSDNSKLIARRRSDSPDSADLLPGQMVSLSFDTSKAQLLED